MNEEEIMLYITHTSEDDFNLEEHQKHNRYLAIQGLLDLYNKEKEKNKQMQEAIKYDFENYTKNYISKDKIREKIKELENEIEIKSLYEENWNKIEVLKELLEEN